MAPPLKLVYLNPTAILGGAEMCLLDLLASLRRSRPDWRLSVILGDEGPLERAVAELGVPYDVLAMPRSLAAMGDAGPGLNRGGRLALAARGPAAGLAAVSYLKELRHVLRSDRFDCVQTNGMKAHVLGAWAAPRGVPVIWHMHDYPSARPVMARLLRWSARSKVRVVAVSKSVAADVARVLGPRVAVETIYNAIDIARFAPGPGDGPRLDARAGLPTAPDGTVRIGLVSTYAKWKGHDVFLEAAARITQTIPLRFYVVGGPIYRSVGSQRTLEELRARARALGLDEAGRLGFVGHREEPADVYRALDVVVHASTRPEPFGRVIVEAMACARAVVAAKAGGAAELFEDGVDALGCSPGDPDALAAILVRLAADPALRESLGAAGRRTAVARFDRSRLADRWAGVYAGEAN